MLTAWGHRPHGAACAREKIISRPARSQTAAQTAARSRPWLAPLWNLAEPAGACKRFWFLKTSSPLRLAVPWRPHHRAPRPLRTADRRRPPFHPPHPARPARLTSPPPPHVAQFRRRPPHQMPHHPHHALAPPTVALVTHDPTVHRYLFIITRTPALTRQDM